MRRIKSDDKGVAGFFLDLPVFLMICVILLLFISTASNLYFKYEEVNTEREMEDACLSLNRQVEMYERILYEGEEGLEYRHFDVCKLEVMDRSELESELDVPLYLSYNITIKVRGEGYIYCIGKEIPGSYKGDVSSYTSPVTVHDSSSGDEFIGSLSVMVWEDL